MAACLNPQFLLDVKQKSHLFTQQIMARVLQTSTRYPLYANVNQVLVSPGLVWAKKPPGYVSFCH